MKILFLILITLTGLQKGKIYYQETERRFLYYLPKTREYSGLIIGLHGGGGSPESFIKLTRGEFNKLAERRKYIVIYPEAVGKHWNDGRNLSFYASQKMNIDDTGFIGKLIEDFQKDYPISSKKAFIVGMSNGGMLALRIACEMPDRVAAIGIVAAGMPQNIKNFCKFQKVNVIMFIGDKDPLIPINGGYVHFLRRRLGKVLSVKEVIQLWIGDKECKPPIVQEIPDRDPDDGSSVLLTKFFCIDGGKFFLYVINNGGHVWPGGSRYLPEFIIGRSNNDIDATQEIFRFFDEIVKSNNN